MVQETFTYKQAVGCLWLTEHPTVTTVPCRWLHALPLTVFFPTIRPSQMSFYLPGLFCRLFTWSILTFFRSWPKATYSGKPPAASPSVYNLSKPHRASSRAPTRDSPHLCNHPRNVCDLSGNPHFLPPNCETHKGRGSSFSCLSLHPQAPGRSTQLALSKFLLADGISEWVCDQPFLLPPPPASNISWWPVSIFSSHLFINYFQRCFSLPLSISVSLFSAHLEEFLLLLLYPSVLGIYQPSLVSVPPAFLWPPNAHATDLSNLSSQKPPTFGE